MSDHARATVALVPVKTPCTAKTRLAPVLGQDECASLCMAMLEDVLDALSQAKHIDEVAVVTTDDTVAAMAKELGHSVLRDDGRGLCAALDSAAATLAAGGATTVLILPADIPTITAGDVDALLERHSGGLSISPAIRDGGTNALVCSPPDAISFCFGRDSASRHMSAAEKSGVPCHRLPVPAFFRDVDLPEDLAWLGNQEKGSHTLDFLRRSGIRARLHSITRGLAS